MAMTTNWKNASFCGFVDVWLLAQPDSRSNKSKG